jgi:hypothetical protein
MVGVCKKHGWVGLVRVWLSTVLLLWVQGVGRKAFAFSSQFAADDKKGIAVLPAISLTCQDGWGMQEAWGRGFDKGMTGYCTAAVGAGFGKESF